MKNNETIIEEKIYREEYSIRKVSDNGIEKYIIKFFGVVNDVEIEITYDEYNLYNGAFSKPLTSYENQIRRRLDNKSFESIINNFPARNDTENLEIKRILKGVLRIVDTCTQTQIRRFNMYFIDELTLKEIALKENCSDRAISKSIKIVLNKLNNYQKL